VIIAMERPAAVQSFTHPGSRKGREDAFQRAWKQVEEQLVVALKNNTLYSMLGGPVEGTA
jgi:hypothetical protein